MNSGDPSEEQSGSQTYPEAPAGMQDWLSEHDPAYRSLRRGEVVEGVVVQVGRDEVLVDIGAKAEAIIPGHELPPRESEATLPLAVGDRVTAYVMNPEDREGHAILSLAR